MNQGYFPNVCVLSHMTHYMIICERVYLGCDSL